MFEALFSRFKRDTIVKESDDANISLDEDNVINEIKNFMGSRKRKDMIDGEKYYDGRHDILSRKRTVIGEGGELEEVKNLPNNRIVDNQYQKMVDQKNNYLLGQPFSIQTNNEMYAKALKNIFNKKFRKLLKNIGEDSLNEGIGWLFVYYDEHGQFTFKRFKPYEIIPIWKDSEHTELNYAIRLYTTLKVEKRKKKYIDHVEVYNQDGIYYFIYDGGKLIPDAKKSFENYFTITDGKGSIQGYNWLKIPLIPFKYNSKEIPLIKKLKSLQDGLNLIESNFLNQMEEDVRNTILVLVNYDGQNLAQFRKNLAQYGAVKVKTIDGAAGDLKTLQIEVNSENYKTIIDLFKKAIIENAKGYDAKDDRLGNNPNQMNIQSIFSDIDLDANGTETEYQAAFEELLWFVNCHLANSGQGNFENEDVEIIFNRDMLISESEIIDNINKSQDLSLESRLAQHPWVDDPQKEMERLQKEKEEEMALYPFPSNDPSKTQPNDEGGDVKDGEQE
jgi:SPP1 family phage portal protein